MSTMTALQVPYDGWTTDDLPETDFGYELVDGSLLVTPPPRLGHDRIADALGDLLKPHLPAGWRKVTSPGVFFDRRNFRQPDLVVYLPSADGKDQLEPSDVVLAVEVVSPSSRATDRVAKPAQYAAAGIPHFWRLEQQPLELVTYALEERTYRETGRFTDAVDVAEPVAVAFRLADLVSG